MDRLLETVGASPPGPEHSEGSAGRRRRGLTWRFTVALSVVAGAACAGLTGSGAAAAGSAPAGAACASATSARYVGLVVQHGDGRTLSRCVRFTGTTMTGEQILKASGVEYQVQSFGSLGDAACQIDHEPASYTQCLPSTGSYWALFVAPAGGAWQEASKGLSQQTYRAGEAAGLRFDPESASTAAPPSAAPPASCTPALGCGGVAATTTGHAGAGSGVSGALIGALAVAALLVVMLGAQVALRRRRTTAPRG